ncbi:GntR family transcriptional regulator, partial [Acidovorax kalamii]|uniref:GntR family transcriptional regulator n=1 Tax=Acidovorax kalamii TaxID=2004485 RepID=UPI0020911A08
MTPSTPVTDPVRHVLLEAPLVRGRKGDSLQRQLLARIRDAILDGRFPSGCRLPGSRDLAADLGVSRNSVTAVYEQLGAEGYIELNRRGTKVAALGRSRARGRADAARAAAAPPSERRSSNKKINIPPKNKAL